MTPRRLPFGVQSSRSRSPTGSIRSPPGPATAMPARKASTTGAALDGANSQLDRVTESTSGSPAAGRGAIAQGIRTARAPGDEATRTPLAPCPKRTVAVTASCTSEEAPGPRLSRAGCAVKETGAPGWSVASPKPTSSGRLERFFTVTVCDDVQPVPVARPNATVAGRTASSAVDAAPG